MQDFILKIEERVLLPKSSENYSLDTYEVYRCSLVTDIKTEGLKLPLLAFSLFSFVLREFVIVF